MSKLYAANYRPRNKNFNNGAKHIAQQTGARISSPAQSSNSKSSIGYEGGYLDSTNIEKFAKYLKGSGARMDFHGATLTADHSQMKIYEQAEKQKKILKQEQFKKKMQMYVIIVLVLAILGILLYTGVLDGALKVPTILKRIYDKSYRQSPLIPDGGWRG